MEANFQLSLINYQLFKRFFPYLKEAYKIIENGQLIFNNASFLF